MKGKLLMTGFIILNYNSANLTIKLAKKLESFEGVKICIVDNCSTDDSMDTLKQEYFTDRVVLVKSLKNGGYSYENNYRYNKMVEK